MVEWIPTDEQCRKMVVWALTPTLREEWRAFYSMYRALRRADKWPFLKLSDATMMCLSPRLRDWWTYLKRYEDCGDKYATPMFVRLMGWKSLRHVYLRRRETRNHLGEVAEATECGPLNFTQADLDDMNGVVRYKHPLSAEKLEQEKNDV